MTTYNRQHIWSIGELLTAADLNTEFDEIAQVLTNLNAANFQAGVIEKVIIVNAGDTRFAPLGSEDNATRVANAIAEAAANTGVDTKVVWVPRGLWGYVQDAGFAAGNFDNSVLLVREGQVEGGYDVVAYGAAVGAAVDNAPAFQEAFDAAFSAGATIATESPGAKKVLVTVPGDYQIDVTVTRKVGVALVEAASVTYSGAANPRFSGTLNEHDQPHPMVRELETITFSGVPAGATIEGGPLFDNGGAGFAPDTMVLVGVRFRIKKAAESFERRRLWMGMGVTVNGYTFNPAGDINGRYIRIEQIDSVGSPGQDMFVVRIEIENTTAGALDIDVEVEVFLRRADRIFS